MKLLVELNSSLKKFVNSRYFWISLEFLNSVLDPVYPNAKNFDLFSKPFSIYLICWTNFQILVYNFLSLSQYVQILFRFTGLEKLRACSCPCNFRIPKSPWIYPKKVHQNFEIPLIFEIYERYFKEMFHYCNSKVALNWIDWNS